MTATKLALVALMAGALGAVPSAVDAKKVKHVHHPVSTRAAGYGVVGSGYVPAPGPSPTPQASYGSSGRPIGTVTAPSVGSYSWPSVGVTNAVPTWSNTGPR